VGAALVVAALVVAALVVAVVVLKSVPPNRHGHGSDGAAADLDDELLLDAEVAAERTAL
jgi:hypothetical protein